MEYEIKKRNLRIKIQSEVQLCLKVPLRKSLSKKLRDKVLPDGAESKLRNS